MRGVHKGTVTERLTRIFKSWSKYLKDEVTHLISNKLQRKSLGHTASVGLLLNQNVAMTNQIHALVDYIHFHGVANMLTDFSILYILYSEYR